MTRILLIRHGETEWNAGDRFRGRADVDLNEKGVLQAKLLAGYLADTEIEAVYSSPLVRARRTAEGIAGNHELKVHIEHDLIDCDFGEWQGMSRSEVQDIYGKLHIKWTTSPEKVKIPGGESLEDVRERASRVIRKLISLHSGTVVLVSHRVVLKVMICMLLGLDDSHFWTIRLDTCGITVFSCENGLYVLTGHNDVSFLRQLAGGGPRDF